MSSAFRSNHDINFIASISRMLALLYYMTAYATKDDVKLHQLVMTSAIFKGAMEKAAIEEGELTSQKSRLLLVRPGGVPTAS
jgi:hypothetical protein